MKHGLRRVCALRQQMTAEEFYFHKSQNFTLKMIKKIKGFEFGVYVFTFVL